MTPDTAPPDTDYPSSLGPDTVPYARPEGVASVAVAPVARMPLQQWLWQGLRASMGMVPRTQGAQPTALQWLMAVVLGVALLQVAALWQVQGPVEFDLGAWWQAAWPVLPVLAVALWAVWAQPSHIQPVPVLQGFAAWSLLSLWAVMPALLLLRGLMAWVRHAPQWWANLGWDAVVWLPYLVLVLWCLLVAVLLSSRCARNTTRAVLLAATIAVVLSLGLNEEPAHPWQPAMADEAAQGDSPEYKPPPRMLLTQAVFATQQAVLAEQLGQLAPQRPGIADLYGLVFAPYADEDVFLRESTMVSDLLRQRFDAKGRVLHLLNHPTSTETHPWATPDNLQAAIAALAATMDREEDVLMVYMTSHGAQNFELAATHGPLTVGTITPQQLRQWLDNAGIRFRVVGISACFSGGWVEPLATDTSLVMTAADATHTSYGCGRLSELTFFGRAVFNEQLRQTFSFTEAFAKAVPLIAQRETDAGKEDGFSNPQIHVGTQIAPVLDAMAQRLATLVPASVPAQAVPAVNPLAP